MKSFFALKTMFALLVAVGLGVVAGCDSPKAEKAKEEAKQAVHDTAEAGKDAAHEIVKEGKAAAHEAAEKVEKETR